MENSPCEYTLNKFEQGEKCYFLKVGNFEFYASKVSERREGKTANFSKRMISYMVEGWMRHHLKLAMFCHKSNFFSLPFLIAIL